MKEWAMFKPGSYWIYQNDSTGELDSTYVTKTYSAHDSSYSDGILRSVSEKFVVFMRNSKKHTITIDASTWCKIHEFSDSTEFRMSFDFLYINNKNEFYRNETFEKINELNLNGLVYSNVFKYKCKASYWGGTDAELNENIYLIARSFWIIKKIETHNKKISEWSLLRSKIIQN
jgi:hypothetical protein